MLRLTGKPKSRVSNRLAIFAALLLVVTSLAGFSNAQLLTNGAESALAAATGNKSQPTKLPSKGFKVSLFLLGNKR